MHVSMMLPMVRRCIEKYLPERLFCLFRYVSFSWEVKAVNCALMKHEKYGSLTLWTKNLQEYLRCQYLHTQQNSDF